MNKILIVTIIVVVFVIGFGAFLLYRAPKETWFSIKEPEEPISPGWKAFINMELDFTIQYPSDTLLPGSHCDSFVVPSSEEERNRIKSIREKGIEIGYYVGGLEMGFCIIKPGGQSLTLADIAEHQPAGVHTNMTFAEREAIQVAHDKFTEIFVLHPSEEIMRVWYKYGEPSYEELAARMLSTFNFLE